MPSSRLVTLTEALDSNAQRNCSSLIQRDAIATGSRSFPYHIAKLPLGNKCINPGSLALALLTPGS
ncbi:MAG TPA: hypothetical protein V6C78_12465 [Crinalium sp.]